MTRRPLAPASALGAAALLLGVLGVAACGPAAPVPVQVRNGGSRPLGQVKLVFQGAGTVSFGDLAPGQASPVRHVVDATDCVAPSAVINGKPEKMILFDCIGNRPLEATPYTWVLAADDQGHLTLLRLDQGQQRPR